MDLANRIKGATGLPVEHVTASKDGG